MNYKDLMPSAADIQQYRDLYGCGTAEAKKRILRESLINWLEISNASKGELQEVLLAILRGDV
jgi:hypothetical protein